MLHFFIAFFLTIASLAAHSQPLEARLDGEVFVQKFAVKSPITQNKTVELVRPSESLENWTKLIGYRYQLMPGADNDPIKVVDGMAALLKVRGAVFSVAESRNKSEAIIEFVVDAKPRGIEFNVFKYARSKDGNGVICVQFAHRFSDFSEKQLQEWVVTRRSWIKQVAEFDMKSVDEALEKVE